MEFHVYELDEGTWQVVDELPCVISIDIAQKCTDDVPLLESASMEFVGSMAWAGGWHMVDMLDGATRSHLGCFRFEAESCEEDSGDVIVKASGYSVLKPSSEETVPDGSYVMAGEDGAAYVASLLSSCPGGVRAEGTFAVPSTIVHDSGCSKLKAAWQVLDAAGWCLRISGDGETTISEMPWEVSESFGSQEPGGMLDGMQVKDGEATYELGYDERRVLDNVRLSFPDMGLDDVQLRVLSRSLSIGSDGITVKETAGVLDRG